MAAKVIDVRELGFCGDLARETEKLKREISILATISHTGVVNLHGVLDTDNMLILFVDVVPLGELFSEVAKGPMAEDQARFVFIQVCETVKFLHHKNIIHRDLKLENILIDADLGGGYLRVKIADFGLSKAGLNRRTQARSYVGTPQYWAPEVILAGRHSAASPPPGAAQNSLHTKKSHSNSHSHADPDMPAPPGLFNTHRPAEENMGSGLPSGPGLGSGMGTGPTYSFQADLWSLGCLLYVMVAGTYPFKCENDWETRILAGQFSFSPPAFANVSGELKDLIVNLLKVDPNERYSMDDVFAHPWMTRPFAPFTPSLPPLHELKSTPIFLNLGPTFFGAPAPDLTPTPPASTTPKAPKAPPPTTSKTNLAVVPGTAMPGGVMPGAVVPGVGADVKFIPTEDAASKSLPLATLATSREAEYRARVASIFSAGEVSELIASVFYRFHQAFLLFRHDPVVSGRISELLSMIRELIADSTKVFDAFAVTCMSVKGLLEDIEFAVEERQAESALELIQSLQSWVREVVAAGEPVKARTRLLMRESSQLVDHLRLRPPPLASPLPLNEPGTQSGTQTGSQSGTQSEPGAGSGTEHVRSAQNENFEVDGEGEGEGEEDGGNDENKDTEEGRGLLRVEELRDSPEAPNSPVAGETQELPSVRQRLDEIYGQSRRAMLEKLRSSASVESMKDYEGETEPAGVMDVLFGGPCDAASLSRMEAFPASSPSPVTPLGAPLPSSPSRCERSLSPVPARKATETDTDAYSTRDCFLREPATRRPFCRDGFPTSKISKLSGTAPIGRFHGDDGLPKRGEDRVDEGRVGEERLGEERGEEAEGTCSVKEECRAIVLKDKYGMHNQTQTLSLRDNGWAWRNRMQGRIRETQALMKGLDELQRIYDILEQCGAFWDHLCVTLDLVSRFRDQMMALLKFSNQSERQVQRLLLRTRDYAAFWDELGAQCKTFVQSTAKTSRNLRTFVRAFNQQLVKADALAAIANAQQMCSECEQFINFTNQSQNSPGKLNSKCAQCENRN